MSSARPSIEAFGSSIEGMLPNAFRNVFSAENSVLQKAQPFLAAVGGLALTYYTAKTLCCVGKGVTTYFLTGPLHLGADLKKSGDWAVITGGTDGLGKEYAFQLAAKGLNVVLISRNLDKLEGVSREIMAKFNVQTKIIAIDLAKMGPRNVPQVEEELKDLDIALLVNCAGTVGKPGKFLVNPETDEEATDLVNLNARALVMVTRAVLPLMVKGISNNKKYVINVGGIFGGVNPCAGFAVYGATKAFVDSFSRALHREYSSSGIHVQSLKPGAIRTKMLPGKFQKHGIPTSDVVSSSLAQLGFRSRTHGHWRHAFLGTIRGLRAVTEVG